MLTAMTEEDWTIVLRVFAASRSRRGDRGRDKPKFLEALTIPIKSRRRAPTRNMSGNPVSIQHEDVPAFFRNTLQGTGTHRTSGRQAQTLQRIALRCEKTAQNYGSFIALALGFILIKSVHTA